MDASDTLPHVVLVGGEGIPSGVPRHIRHLATAYQGLARVTVLSDENHGGYDALANLDVTHVTLPGLKSRLSLRHMWQGWRGLTRYLNTTDADLVWIHPRFPSLLGRAALALRVWRPRYPTAFTIHGLPFGKGHRPRASALSLLLEKALLAACPPLNLVFLSPEMAGRMRNHVGVRRLARHTTHVLPNCSDLGALPPSQPGKTRHLVMTGRTGQQKNYLRAAELFAHLPQDFTLTLCGSGTETAAFQSRIATAVPQDTLSRITFAGPVLDVRPHLMAADAYLLTSRYEGTPIGTLEAFEAGLPIALSTFEDAGALVDAHPCSVMLELQDLAADATKITQLVDTFRADPDSFRQQIRDAWRARWSPDVFTANSIQLLNTFLRPSG